MGKNVRALEALQAPVTKPALTIFVTLALSFFAVSSLASPMCIELFLENSGSTRVWNPGGSSKQPLPGSESPMFNATYPLQLKIKGDFEGVFRSNEGGNWTGEKRNDWTLAENSPYWFDISIADLQQPDQVLQAKMRGRGMSSASETEARFPKLRITIPGEQDGMGSSVKGTVFRKARSFKINTHVNSNPVTELTEMGRLNGELSPYREASAYEIAETMGLPGPKVRRARIRYQALDGTPEIERNALLLETDKAIEERFGASRSENFPSDDPAFQIPASLGARFHLFNIMIGNEDIGLKLKAESATGTEKYRPLFNTTVFEIKSQDHVELFPIVYDFDLASLVTGWREINLRYGRFPELGVGDAKVGSMLRRIAELRSRLSREEFNEAVVDVSKKQADILRVIENTKGDDGFKALAREHVSAFFTAIASLEKIPMLLRKDLRLFKEANLNEDLLKEDGVNEAPGTLRAGTPIRVLEIKGGVAKIAIVDIRHDLVDPDVSVGYIKGFDPKIDVGFNLPENLQGLVDGRDMTW